MTFLLIIQGTQCINSRRNTVSKNVSILHLLYQWNIVYYNIPQVHHGNFMLPMREIRWGKKKATCFQSFFRIHYLSFDNLTLIQILLYWLTWTISFQLFWQQAQIMACTVSKFSKHMEDKTDSKAKSSQDFQEFLISFSKTGQQYKHRLQTEIL